jgi:hypothetical protein
MPLDVPVRQNCRTPCSETDKVGSTPLTTFVAGNAASGKQTVSFEKPTTHHWR